MIRNRVCQDVSLTSTLIVLSLFCVKAKAPSSPVAQGSLTFSGRAMKAQAEVLRFRRKAHFVSGYLVARNKIGEDKPAITILVNNTAQLPLADLAKSESEAGRIFRQSGIAVTWVDCSSKSAGETCRHTVAPNQFVLQIAARGQTSTDTIFGVSFLGSDGTGTYSDVFYDRIQQVHRESGVDRIRLLATVAAHEIGHLLLGFHSHSLTGIMSPHWSKEELRRIGMGCMQFTPEQSSRMRARIARCLTSRDFRDAGEFQNIT
jgi:hypothetical protein